MTLLPSTFPGEKSSDPKPPACPSRHQRVSSPWSFFIGPFPPTVSPLRPAPGCWEKPPCRSPEYVVGTPFASPFYTQHLVFLSLSWAVQQAHGLLQEARPQSAHPGPAITHMVPHRPVGRLVRDAVLAGVPRWIIHASQASGQVSRARSPWLYKNKAEPCGPSTMVHVAQTHGATGTEGWLLTPEFHVLLPLNVISIHSGTKLEMWEPLVSHPPLASCLQTVEQIPSPCSAALCPPEHHWPGLEHRTPSGLYLATPCSCPWSKVTTRVTPAPTHHKPSLCSSTQR